MSEPLCDICPFKTDANAEAFMQRIKRIAKLEAFVAGLARTVPLDWAAIGDKLKNEISLEAIATGLNIADKVALLGPIDSEIHAEMKRQRAKPKEAKRDE